MKRHGQPLFGLCWKNRHLSERLKLRAFFRIKHSGRMPRMRLPFSLRLRSGQVSFQSPPLGTDNDFRKINLHGQCDSQQGVQTGTLHLLLNVADGLPGNSRFPGKHLERKVALFALRSQEAGHVRTDGVGQFVIRHREAIPKKKIDL